jgi:hypothetical protein
MYLYEFVLRKTQSKLGQPWSTLLAGGVTGIFLIYLLILNMDCCVKFYFLSYILIFDKFLAGVATWVLGG